MSHQHDRTRRALLTSLASLTVAKMVLPSSASASAELPLKDRRTLVAYLSRSGNTRVIAGVIHRSLQSDLFEIEPATPYPDDYFQTVEQAKIERDRGFRPPLKSSVSNIEHYQTIYLGFPIWGTTLPPVVQTFLTTHNLADKALVPFITHGGYGVGNSEAVLATLAPHARREKPLIIECDQERRTTETVTRWLTTFSR
ncbi:MULTISPECIES: flavodoxin [unclassified Symbiopectobacterium]|uniref:flavodoxin n=1 Tax=unclassified Symbiopectobacterium TaxID=2794573 RepID=UPI002227C72E|nr:MULTISPECIES: flavodoxin [unclassified Symbiopectobacterium]MCW2473096.1 flavodoxin [Candidatus Symbiopectobacterium sp. NZEC151]MCW2482653.1 flavodoxin [Candidatus Symbiopectobacterium sp. NZEC135]